MNQQSQTGSEDRRSAQTREHAEDQVSETHADQEKRESVSEVDRLEEPTPAGDADSVPETAGDNNKDRPVDYGGA